MTGSLTPYAVMKDSGVECLGKIPHHWEVQRLGRLGNLMKGNGGSKDDEVEHGIPCIRYGDLYTTHQHFIKRSRSFVSEESACRYTPVQLGDVLFAASGETIPEIGKSAVNFISSNARCGGDIILFRPVQEFDARFLGYLLDCQPIADQKAAMGRGITVMHIYGAQLKYLSLPWPPPPEQSAIARFLDHVNDRIDRYIRAKEKLIALLEEQKQAIVYQAVTGRIDIRTGRPYPAHKPSGVEWLGDVPAHWHIMPLKKVTLTRCDGPFGSGLKSSHYADRGVRVIRLQNIGHGEFNNTDFAYISFSHYATLGDHSVEAGDVLIAGLGDPNHPAGRACVAPVCIEPAMVKADCFRFRLNGDVVDSKFISLQLAATANAASAILSTGATRQRINLYSTSARLMALPSLSEQVTVVDFVDKAISEVNSSVARSQRQIGLVREYRTRLIADIVTGKLDVRSTAADLPELEPITDGGRLDAIQDEADFPIAEGSIAQEAS